MPPSNFCSQANDEDAAPPAGEPGGDEDGGTDAIPREIYVMQQPEEEAVRAFFVHTAAPPRKQRRRGKKKGNNNNNNNNDDDDDEMAAAAAETEQLYYSSSPSPPPRTRTVLAQPLWTRTADCTLLQIQQKLAGYVRQDERKGRAAPEPPLTVAATLAMLEAAQFRCTYCARDMPRVWTAPRDPAQWTLDRVDNARPHQIDNVVPSCMECNLRRRARSHWAFRRGAALAAATVAEAAMGGGGSGGGRDDACSDDDDEWVVARRGGCC